MMAATRGSSDVVTTGEYDDPATPFASRLAHRFMFAELIGTAFYTLISAGVVVSSGMITNNVSYQKLTMGRVLMLALANGLAFCSLAYAFYSFLSVQRRTEALRYGMLEENEPVYIRAHNAAGWLDGKVSHRVVPEKATAAERDQQVQYQVEAFRTGANKIVPRNNIRSKLFRGMVAYTEDDVPVKVVSDGLSSNQSTYDIEFFDGTRDKAELFSLRIPARRRFVVGHFNPVVTYAVCLVGDIQPEQALMYITAQLFGGCLGAMFVDSVVPTEYKAQLGTPMLGDGVTFSEGIKAEFLLSGLVIFVILMTFAQPLGRQTDIRHPFTTRELGPLVAGLVIFVASIVGAPLTGPSMNVARSFGSAVVSLTWDNHAVYWIGPWLGSLLAVLCWTFFANFNEFARGNVAWNGRYNTWRKRVQYVVDHEMLSWCVATVFRLVSSCCTCKLPN